MEQNENPSATAGVAWPSQSQPASLPSVAAGEPPTVLDFDPVTVQYRCDGWTPARQRAFIEELADCGVVREAAARVGMTEQSAGRLRRRADAAGFNLAWEAALQLGADRLRSIAFERAITGTVKKHYYRGEVVGEDRLYDNRLLTYLLNKAQPLVNGFDARNVLRDWDRWMEAIEQGLDKPMQSPDESSTAPVWRAEDGSWWTNFPAPPEFDGAQLDGEEDGEGFRRECTPDEVEAIEAARSRFEAEQARRRDLYFNADRMTFRTPRQPNFLNFLNENSLR